MIAPFGSEMDQDKVDLAIGVVEDNYSGLPETTCHHRACCCKAGCPNMYFSEYMNMRIKYLNDMQKTDRLDLLMKCIEYYLIPQFSEVGGKRVPNPKPCVHLGKDNMCKVYDARPLKCRTYGLVPDDMHNRILDTVSKESGVPKADVPLCIQCPFVQVKKEYEDDFPDGKIPEKMIADIESKIMKADIDAGIPKEIQSQGYGFLTFHDWHVICELGESWLPTLTGIRQDKDSQWKKKFLSDLRSALSEGEEQDVRDMDS